MLKIKRRLGETLIPNTADGLVRIEFGLNGRQFNLAIDAPTEVEVLRSWLVEKEAD